MILEGFTHVFSARNGQEMMSGNQEEHMVSDGVGADGIVFFVTKKRSLLFSQ